MFLGKNSKKKLIRITTVPIALTGLLKGQLKYMITYFDVAGISSYEDELIDEIGERETIRTILVDMTRKIMSFKDIVAVYKLFKIFKNEQPFIVHTHTPASARTESIGSNEFAFLFSFQISKKPSNNFRKPAKDLRRGFYDLKKTSQKNSLTFNKTSKKPLKPTSINPYINGI